MSPSLTSPPLRMRFATRPDLAATMDIQIPALAWQPLGAGRYWRIVYLDTGSVDVTLWQAGEELCFGYDDTDPAIAARVEAFLRASFPVQVADLDLGDDPALITLHQRYAGVVVMWAAPFEALVLTVLSQNRSGETVRQVYPLLAGECAGVTPTGVAALDVDRLREVIRSAGPYKAPRLTALSARIAREGAETFTHRVTTWPTATALAYLESLPGVAHKTAACVLVFSARTRDTLPVDTHLFRVAGRLGLAIHDGRSTQRNRDALIAALLAHSPDLALAHFVFLLIGRTTCTATSPDCDACLLQPSCRHADLAAVSTEPQP